MSLIILEGLDRTGKSSVAAYFQAKGFELIHQSAPPKGQTADNFLEEQVQLVASAATRNIVLDRSYYGELVWPQVYGRDSLLNDESLEVLRELEEQVGTTRILMTDNNVEAHWKRCVDNNEPMTKPQFIKARALFGSLADKHGFDRKTLLDFPEVPIIPQEPKEKPVAVVEATAPKPVATAPKMQLTKEQMKLETANAINDVLSKRIIKQKGQFYDQIEIGLRTYLNTELGKILGTKAENVAGQFSNDELEILRAFCKQVKEKQR